MRGVNGAGPEPGWRGKLIMALPVISLLALACSPSQSPAPSHPQKQNVQSETLEPDLAALMGEMQRHSMKLSYAIDAQNKPLADFYAHEVEEVLEAVESIAEHDGVPIGAPAKGALRAPLSALEASLDAADWDAAQTRYEALITGCNNCHQATDHSFVVITKPPQPPPFNQSFAAQ